MGRTGENPIQEGGNIYGVEGGENKGRRNSRIVRFFINKRVGKRIGSVRQSGRRPRGPKRRPIDGKTRAPGQTKGGRIFSLKRLVRERSENQKGRWGLGDSLRGERTACGNGRCVRRRRQGETELRTRGWEERKNNGGGKRDLWKTS